MSEYIPDDFQEQNMDSKENGSRSPTIELESEDGWEEDPNCFEMIHSRFAPSRRLKADFFNEDIAVSVDFSAEIVFIFFFSFVILKKTSFEILENAKF